MSDEKDILNFLDQGNMKHLNIANNNINYEYLQNYITNNTTDYQKNNVKLKDGHIMKLIELLINNINNDINL